MYHGPTDKMASDFPEDGSPVVRSRALVTLDTLVAGAKSASLGYVRMGPANHHGNYFDVEYLPTGTDGESLRSEIIGSHPLCSLCFKPRVSECVGHRIGLILPFYMIQPQFADMFIKFLNAICLNVLFDSAGLYKLDGCGRPRGVPKKGSLAVRLSSSGNECKTCHAARAGTAKSAKFVHGEYGGLAYIRGNRNVPISLSGVMDYLSKPGTRDNMLESGQIYRMNVDIRTMVTNKLYIAPSQLRPTRQGRRDFETDTYLDIANHCATVPYPQGASLPDSINTSVHIRQYAQIYTLISQLMTSKPKNPDCETLFHKLPGKHGYIRQHVTGGYTSNVGRAVVAPSEGNFGEFLISRYFQSLTTAEVVNRYTIERLRTLAAEGLVSWVRDGRTGEDRKYDPGLEIHLGDTVWRHLMTGDITVANRQPTLHRLSLMAHNIRFVMQAVVKLHGEETTPYNADFDGDEMNMEPATSEVTSFELRILAHAVNNIMGPGAPAMAPVFHNLAIMMILSIRVDDIVPCPEDYLSAYTQSQDLHKRLASYGARRQALRNKGIIPNGSDALIATYRDVCSLLFPEDFSYPSRGIRIINGVLVSGEFVKSNIGLSPGSITHMLSYYSSKRAALFINDVARICNVYMLSTPVSFNPAHMIQEDDYYAKIAALATSTRKQLEAALQMKAGTRSVIEREQIERRIVLLAAAPLGHIMKTIGQTKPRGEATIRALKARGAGTDEIDSAKQTIVRERVQNIFEIMFLSGCRGSTRSAMQMSMTLGAQYTGTERTDASRLPWVRNLKAARAPDGRPKQTILANGIIESSFMNGLTPEQYAVHASPVRYQVVKGKLEVSGSGYKGKQMSAIYGQFRTDLDLATVTGTMVISMSLGGFLNPTALVVGKVHGHGYASFVDPATLVASVNYNLQHS